MVQNSIRVSRSLYLEAGDAPAAVTSISYVSSGENTLIESSYIAGRDVIRRSEDGGLTWKVVEQWESETALQDDLKLVRTPPCFFLDPETGRLLRFFWTHHIKPSAEFTLYTHSPVWRTLRNYIQVSKDEGRTWGPPEQVITQGGGHDQVHWADWIWYGKNAAGIVPNSHLVKAPDGSVLAPFEGMRLFENGDIIDPSVPKEMSNPDGDIDTVGGCFIGCWRNDGSGLNWSEGRTIRLPRELSCDGAEEPSMDYLPDGRLLAVLRARVYPHTGQKMPSLKYYVLSSDHGRSWTEPQPLLYDDGSYAYSPSSFGGVLRSSRNGRFYIITNLNQTPPVNCWPRHKLQIAEIDANSLTIKRDSVTVIEQRQPDQPEAARFSNFRWYEERGSKDIILYLTHGGCAPAHAYRYRIQLPDED